jgi:hypothetical protein
MLKQFETTPFTLSLQLIQAFHDFSLKTRRKAIVKRALELQLNEYQAATAKMELADILLYEEKFNHTDLLFTD